MGVLTSGRRPPRASRSAQGARLILRRALAGSGLSVAESATFLPAVVAAISGGQGKKGDAAGRPDAPAGTGCPETSHSRSDAPCAPPRPPHSVRIRLLLSGAFGRFPAVPEGRPARSAGRGGSPEAVPQGGCEAPRTVHRRARDEAAGSGLCGEDDASHVRTGAGQAVQAGRGGAGQTVQAGRGGAGGVPRQARPSCGNEDARPVPQPAGQVPGRSHEVSEPSGHGELPGPAPPLLQAEDTSAVACHDPARRPALRPSCRGGCSEAPRGAATRVPAGKARSETPRAATEEAGKARAAASNGR